jgi:hypothetical protein
MGDHDLHRYTPCVIPKPSTPPSVPNALRLEEALRRSAPLERLQQLLQDSKARFEAVRPALPAALAASVAPGPIDETAWTLLAANASVAAKLRQLRPRLEALLRERGWEPNAIQIRVQSG